MKISAAAFSTKSIPNFVSSYALAFAISIAILTIICIVAQYVYTWQPELILSQVLIGLAAAVAPIIVKSNEGKVTLIAPILQDITSNGNKQNLLFSELQRVEKSAWANVFPIVIMLLGVFSLYLFGSPWRGWNPVAHNAFSIFVILFFLVAGILGWQYISLIVTLFVASRFDVDANIFHWPLRQIKKLNQITIEIYFAGVLIY